MLIKSEKKVTTAIYDSILKFGIEYIEQYNLFCCRIHYDNNHGSVAFVKSSTGFYIMKRLETIDVNRKHWNNTDKLLWSTINHLNWIN